MGDTNDMKTSGRVFLRGNDCITPVYDTLLSRNLIMTVMRLDPECAAEVLSPNRLFEAVWYSGAKSTTF